MFKAFCMHLFFGDVLEEKLRCPWCGVDFQDAVELDAHARAHYCKELVA
jgi:hypothetical protein